MNVDGGQVEYPRFAFFTRRCHLEIIGDKHNFMPHAVAEMRAPSKTDRRPEEMLSLQSRWQALSLGFHQLK